MGELCHLLQKLHPQETISSCSQMHICVTQGDWCTSLTGLVQSRGAVRLYCELGKEFCSGTGMDRKGHRVLELDPSACLLLCSKPSDRVGSRCRALNEDEAPCPGKTFLFNLE